MAETIDVRVPDIGDFQDVPVVDVFVKAGDTVAVEEPLVTLESDKATMEIPSPLAGVVASVVVNVGDKVSEGSALITVRQANGAAAPPPAAVPAPAKAEPAAEPAISQPAASNGAAHAGGAQTLVELRVPDIGDFADVPVIDVLVKPGDRIELEAPLVTLESEKASMDIPASAGGTIRDVLVHVGDKVSQGTPVATVATGAAALPSEPVAPAPSAPAVQSPPPSEAPSPAGMPSSYGAAGGPEPAASAASQTKGLVHATPSIRRFARELGVDLTGVGGTGPHGRITREDVQQYVKKTLAAPPPARAASSGGLELLPWPRVDFARFGPVERVPLSRIRTLSGPNLHRNWVMIPHVTNNDEADVTELEEFRKRLNAENPAAKVTLLAFVMKAVVAALKAFPDVNSSLDGDALVLKKYYNIGFAADTPSGLVVPVLKAADTKGVFELASESAALAAKARDGKLGMAELQGATFTISSLGGIGGTSFTPIVNAPEVAILGVSRSAIRPVWDGAAFVPRLLLPLSLSYDHRVIDGALAARFNAHLVRSLADLRRTLL